MNSRFNVNLTLKEVIADILVEENTGEDIVNQAAVDILYQRVPLFSIPLAEVVESIVMLVFVAI